MTVAEQRSKHWNRPPSVFVVCHRCAMAQDRERRIRTGKRVLSYNDMHLRLLHPSPDTVSSLPLCRSRGPLCAPQQSRRQWRPKPGTQVFARIPTQIPRCQREMLGRPRDQPSRNSHSLQGHCLARCTSLRPATSPKEPTPETPAHQLESAKIIAATIPLSCADAAQQHAQHMRSLRHPTDSHRALPRGRATSAACDGRDAPRSVVESPDDLARRIGDNARPARARCARTPAVARAHKTYGSVVPSAGGT